MRRTVAVVAGLLLALVGLTPLAAHADAPVRLVATGVLGLVLAEPDGELYNLTTDAQQVLQLGDEWVEPVGPRESAAGPAAGDRVAVTLELPSELVETLALTLGEALTGDVDATSETGLAVVEAVGDTRLVVLGIESARSTARSERQTAASVTPRIHAIDIAVVTVPGEGAPSITNAELDQIVAGLSAYYLDQSNGQISGFVRQVAVKRYTSTTSCAWGNFPTLMNEAAGKFASGRTAAYYAASNGVDKAVPRHLLVISPESCNDPDTKHPHGLGTVGPSNDSGLTVNGWVLMPDREPQSYLTTLVHEIGHNIGFGHAGAIDACGGGPVLWTEAPDCTAYTEYEDITSPMAWDVGTTAVPALGAAHAAQIDAFDDGELLVLDDTGADIVELSAISADEGVRAIYVVEPSSGWDYYIEYRDATGMDADTAYTKYSYLTGLGQLISNCFEPGSCGGYTSANGFGTGVHVTFPWDGAAVAVPVRTTTTYPKYLEHGLEAGEQYILGESGGVRVEVLSIAAGVATLRVQRGTDPSIAASAPIVSDMTPAYGDTITASVSDWDPWPLDSVTYRWFVGSGEVPGAGDDGEQLLIDDPAWIGQPVTVRATGTLAGYLDAVRETQTAAVVGQSLSTQPDAVDILGNVWVGSTVAADAGTWGPSPVDLAYQWLAGGAAITGATSAAFLIPESLAGKSLSVRVTASKPTYQTVVLTSAGIQVTKNLSEVDAELSVPLVGTVEVPLQAGATVGVGSISATVAGTRFAYQWYRQDAAIKGATRSTYRLTSADAGRLISLRIIATKSGYPSTTLWLVAGVAERYLSRVPTARPVILSADGTSTTLGIGLSGSWAPAVPDSWTTQWYRNGVAIDGASAATYTTIAADVGKTITARLTPVLAGYGGRVVTSSGFKVGAPLGDISSGSSWAGGDLPIGTRVTAVRGAVPSKTKTAYQWYRGSTATPIKQATGSAYTVTTADAGQELLLRITYTRAGSQTQIDWVTVGTAEAAFLSRPMLSIRNVEPTEGGMRLVADLIGQWAPEPDALSYAWYRSGVVSPVSETAEYSTVADDLGRTLTLVVTATRAGTTPVVLKATLAVAKKVLTGAAPAGALTLPTSLEVGAAVKVVGVTGPLGAKPAYQWYRDGVAIKKATGSSYRIAAADAGTELSLRILYAKSGYQPQQAWLVAGEVLGYLATTPRASIVNAGPVEGGTTLEVALAGAWGPVTDPDLAIAWYRSGVSEPVATGLSYQTGPADVGRSITARVTASTAGSSDRVISTAAYKVGTILGTVSAAVDMAAGAVGSTVRVTGLVRPAGSTVAYQWLRDGTAIKQATGSSYTPVAADAGKTLSVRLTARKAGAQTTVLVVPGGMVLGYFATVPKVGIVQQPQPDGTTLLVPSFTGQWGPQAHDALSYAWYVGSTLKGSGSSYQVQAADKGRTFVLKVTASAAGVSDRTVASTALKIGAVFTAAGGTVQATPVAAGFGEGVVYYAVPIGFTPSSKVSYRYQWVLDGILVEGARGTVRTWQVGAGETGLSLSVVITGTRSGYQPRAVEVVVQAP